MKRLCSVIVVLLLVVVAGGVYKFLIQGAVEQANDGRLSLQLEAAERDLVLGEMRQFLQAVQQITEAVSNEQVEKAAKSARSVGMGAQQGVPGSLMAKLPLEFKKLGFDTHSRFDQLALDAEELGDPGHTLQQLAELMRNCVACHAAYRIDVQAEAK